MTSNPLIAEIDLSAIVHNCNVFRSLVPTGCKICPAVKCNAFGHNIKITLPAFIEAGVEMLSVATIREACQLRELGWKKPILLFGSELSMYHGKQKTEIARWVVENQLRITVTRKIDIETLMQAAKACKTNAVIHIMLDSGMHRMGIYEQNLLELIDNVKDSKCIYIEGIYTHFATADEYDKSYAQQQLKRFNAFIDFLNKRGTSIPIIHSAGSAAAIDLPQSHFNMIRPGISIYGCHSSPQMRNKPNLKPVMKVVSFLTLIKFVSAGSYIGYGCTYKASEDMLVGLVPVGYGDGYDRHLSNKGKMMIADQLVPIVGRISMDQTVVDLRPLNSKGIVVAPGQKVIVIDNVRNAPNSVESLAVELGTGPNEILTKMGHRIMRMPV